MYVALTRARHQVVVWWGRADQCRYSPLGRLLISRDKATGAVRDAFSSDPRDKDIQAAAGLAPHPHPPGVDLGGGGRRR